MPAARFSPYLAPQEEYVPGGVELEMSGKQWI